MIDVLLPVLGRPRSAQPVVDSIHAATTVSCCITFLCSPGDDRELQACLDTHADVIRVNWHPGPGDYAKKINGGIVETKMPWILMGADDLEFEEGWDVEALAEAERTNKRVIATNDMANPEVMRGRHATHPLVARSYIEAHGTIDGKGFYHEGYDHQCVDVEATETAQARGEFSFAARSIVRHLHPVFNRQVKMDDTYKKGMARGQQDIALLRERRPLWNPNYRSRRR